MANDALRTAFKSYDTDETNEQYHASEGLSFSGLKLLSKTPRHYYMSKIVKKTETASQRVGTLTHMALLEPERFKKIVKPIDGNRNAKEVQLRIDEAEREGYYVCKPKEYKDAAGIADYIETTDFYKKYIRGGVAEVSLRCVHDDILLKCRPDYLHQERKIIVDVKTFNDLDIDSIERQIYKMKYHWQSAFYLFVLEKSLNIKTTKFVHMFVDVENAIIRNVVLDDAALEKAFEEMSPYIQQYKNCLTNNKWPAYPDELVTVSLPSYGWK